MEIDFLTPNAKQIRHQLKNVIDSYNNDWDILAELAQNSVDAIKLEKPIKGHIILSIDAVARTVLFQDNGCGISPKDLPSLLAPFSSDKGNNVDLIGNKGVGITFVIFSTDEFTIETHHHSGSARAKFTGGNAWVNAQTIELPKLEYSEIEQNGSHGTTISLKLPDLPDSVDHDFFRLEFKQIEMLLRTKTALGDTNKIWTSAKADKDFVFSFRDLNGTLHAQEIECNYFLPIEQIGKNAIISIREFEDWNSGDKTDAQKRQKLRDKVVYHDGQMTKAGRKINFWACFVPKRKAWDIVSVKSGLYDESILVLNPMDRADQFGDLDYLFSGGMFTATRGMPTGIRSEMKTKGSGGYLPNFFIIIDDPMLSFDIGRKSIPGRQLGMLRDLASDIFRTFIASIRKYISGEPEAEEDA